MIKLLNLIKESLNEPIEKDANWWVKNYNILGIINGFLSQHKINIQKNFIGELNIIIYDRSIGNKIKNLIKTQAYLDGFVPKIPNDEFMDYDFIMMPDKITSFKNLTQKLSTLKDQILLLQIKCELLDNGHIQSSVKRSQ